MCFFLCIVTLPDQIFLLLGRKISPSELVLANPGKSFVFTIEVLFMGAEPDARMRLRDAVAVVTVHNRIVPDDERHEHKPFLKDVFFELRKLVITTATGHAYTRSAMFRRNHYLVDNADLLLAAYDGQPGGTAMTCELARRYAVPVMKLHPTVN